MADERVARGRATTDSVAVSKVAVALDVPSATGDQIRLFSRLMREAEQRVGYGDAGYEVVDGIVNSVIGKIIAELRLGEEFATMPVKVDVSPINMLLAAFFSPTTQSITVNSTIVEAYLELAETRHSEGPHDLLTHEGTHALRFFYAPSFFERYGDDKPASKEAILDVRVEEAVAEFMMFIVLNKGRGVREADAIYSHRGMEEEELFSLFYDACKYGRWMEDTFMSYSKGIGDALGTLAALGVESLSRKEQLSIARKLMLSIDTYETLQTLERWAAKGVQEFNDANPDHPLSYTPLFEEVEVYNRALKASGLVGRAPDLIIDFDAIRERFVHRSHIYDKGAVRE